MSTNFPKIPHACIFDVDDTLISNYYPDGRGMHETARYEAMQLIGHQPGKEALLGINEQENHEVVHIAPQHTMESITWTLLHAHGLVDGLEIDKTNELLQEIISIKNRLYTEKLKRDGKEVPGAKVFLQYLHQNDIKLAIASGAYLKDIQIDLEIIGVSDIFQSKHIKALGSYTKPKPSPEPFIVALHSLGLDGSEQNIWAFEDDTRGIRSAQDAGLRVCALTSRYTEAVLTPYLKPDDILIQDYNDLMQRLGL